MRIMILNGPNLNMLGIREPHIYGSTTLDAIKASCEEFAAFAGAQLSFHQSNHEGELVDLIQSARTEADALIINPATLKAQIEGNVLQTLSRTLFEEVAFDRSRVTSVDWASYPILRFPDAPEVLIELVNRPLDPPLGAGEASATPVPAALANAVYDAIGARVTTVPFTRERVRAAVAGA